MSFTDEEVTYLRLQRLARLATVSEDGQPDVVERDGYVGPGTYLRITPPISWSWNLDGRPFTSEASGDQLGPRVTRTVHRQPGQDQEGQPARRYPG